MQNEARQSLFSSMSLTGISEIIPQPRLIYISPNPQAGHA